MKDKILKIFSSNIKIKVTGKNINNFLKRLIYNNINIIKVVNISYKEADLIINYQDLEKINKYKTIYNIEVIEYQGKLKLLKLIKKNIFIISFLILSLIIIYILSNVIFSVEVIHSNSSIIKLLEKELNYYGIKKYSFVKSYNEIEKIENKILKDNKDNLEWLEITREGTKYIVRVEERIINKDNQDTAIYNITASKNAIIKVIEATKGEKQKEVNNYVTKGEVIISPYITMPNNEKVLSSAKGSVLGEVWYTINIEYPYSYNEISYTGKSKKVWTFTFLNKRISLFDFKKYKSFNKDTKVIFKDNISSLSLNKEYQYETKVINDILTYDEVKEKAISLAKKKLKDKYNSIKDITKVITINEEDLGEKLSLTLFVTCTEDITSYSRLDPNQNIQE